MTLSAEEARLPVRRFFRSVFALADHASVQSQLPWRLQSVDHFFGAAFAPLSAPSPKPAGECGTGSKPADDFFSEFNWD